MNNRFVNNRLLYLSWKGSPLELVKNETPLENNRLLCLSWNGFLLELLQQEIPLEKWKNALFCFGKISLKCVEQPWRDDSNYLGMKGNQKVIYCPSNWLTWCNRLTRRRADKLHATVCDVIASALKDHRAVFMQNTPSFKILNKLLRTHNFGPVTEGEIDGDGGEYTDYHAALRVYEACLPVEVVY